MLHLLHPLQVFFYFLMVTSIIVAGQLILGGSAVIHALTGMLHRPTLSDILTMQIHRDAKVF